MKLALLALTACALTLGVAATSERAAASCPTAPPAATRLLASCPA